MKNKTSKIYFTVLFAFLFIASFLPLALNISHRKRAKFEKYIGESQIQLLKTYEKGEKILYYVDETAKLSLKETMEEYDYNVSDLSGPTFSEDYKKNITDSFKKNFKSYLENFPDSGILIDLNNYKLDFDVNGDNLEMIGTYSGNLTLQIREDEQILFEYEKTVEEIPERKKIGFYHLNPSFRIRIPII